MHLYDKQIIVLRTFRFLNFSATICNLKLGKCSKTKIVIFFYVFPHSAGTLLYALYPLHSKKLQKTIDFLYFLKAFLDFSPPPVNFVIDLKKKVYERSGCFCDTNNPNFMTFWLCAHKIIHNELKVEKSGI